MINLKVDNMSEIGLEEKSGLPFPVAAEDTHFFDLAQFRANMAKSLDPANEANAVFFEALSYASELHAGQRRKSGRRISAIRAQWPKSWPEK